MTLRPVLAVVLLALGGCAAAPITVENMADDYAGPVGTISGSIASVETGELRNLNSFSTLYFRAVDGEVSGRIGYAEDSPFRDQQRRDFESEGQDGTVFLLRLPAGDYEIYSYHFYFNNGSVEKSYRPDEDLQIPFSVTADRTTYLGEFLAWGRRGKNMFGISIPAGGAFTWSDKAIRDLPVIKSVYPDFTVEAVDTVDLSPYFLPAELAPELLLPD